MGAEVSKFDEEESGLGQGDGNAEEGKDDAGRCGRFFTLVKKNTRLLAQRRSDGPVK